MVFINDKTKVIISLEVSDPVRQPYGLLHGGVNAVMAETAASLGANQNVGPDEYAVGVNINTQHLLPVTSGLIIATATPLQLGHRIQTRQVTITNYDHLTSTVILNNHTNKK